MELSAAEIKKISKKFNIPEGDLLDFLANEERLLRIELLKNDYLQQKKKGVKIEISKKWAEECKEFAEFEDFYLTVDDQFPKDFFFSWLAACVDYKERRDAYLCLPKNFEFKEKFLNNWIEDAKNIEDVRTAMAYADKGSSLYLLGIKKITNIYKNS